ncbi:TPA: hypothetical protein TZN81_001143 [Streptococcus suis]|nr:hypothetical protein [Streptococcus suis]
MKKKALSAILFGSVTLNSIIVYAVTNESSLPSVTYENYKGKLEGFTSKAFFEKTDIIGLDNNVNYLINNLVQAMFWVTKMIFSICAGIYELLKGGEEMDKYLNKVIDYSASVYGSLASNNFGLLALFGAIVGVYAAYLYFVKNGSFFKPIAIFLLVFSFNSLFFSKDSDGVYRIKTVKNTIQNVGSDITKELTKLNSNIETKGLSFNRKDEILELYFKVALWEPYRYLNADVGDNSEDNNGFVLSDRQLQQLVEYKTGDETFKIDNIKIADLAGTMREPKVKMLKDSWGLKFSYAFASLFDAIALGSIVGVVGIVSYVLSVLIIILILLAPAVMLLAFIPTFENILLNFFKKIGGSIFINGILTLITVFVIFYYIMVRDLVNALVGQNIILSAILRLASIFYAYKKRDFILSILTANRVSQLSNNVTRRISGAGNYLKDKASNNAMKRLKTVQGVTRRMGRNGVATAGVGLTMAAGAMKLGGRKLLNKGVSKIKENQPGLSNTVGLYKSTLGDVGSRLSSVKHRLVGKAQHLQAEGLKGSYKHPDHKELRESSERNLQIAKDKKNQSLGYKVRKHNQETKEGLLGQRQKRDGVHSGFRQYAMKERAYQSEQTQRKQEQIQSQASYNRSTKERLRQNRRLRENKPKQTSGFRNYRIKENQTLSKIRKTEPKHQ